MSLDALTRLQEEARSNEALRLALDAATTAADLVALARQNDLALDAGAAQNWLDSQAAQSPSAASLAALSQGLSANDDSAMAGLPEAALEAIAGGGGGVGEAALGEAL
ncbi:MAG: Nif11 family protein [Cyanobacteriota bacterium]|nr:Nif11 family protein [Cyanobacteriota bacterium]